MKSWRFIWTWCNRGRSGFLRDRGLLESAVAAAQSGAGETYFHGTLAEMGAAYLFHLVKDHPFVDGNKRIGQQAAVVFLALNGIYVIADQDDFADLVLALAAGRGSKADLAAFLAEHGRTERAMPPDPVPVMRSLP